MWVFFLLFVWTRSRGERWAMFVLHPGIIGRFNPQSPTPNTECQAGRQWWPFFPTLVWPTLDLIPQHQSQGDSKPLMWLKCVFAGFLHWLTTLQTKNERNHSLPFQAGCCLVGLNILNQMKKRLWLWILSWKKKFKCVCWRKTYLLDQPL